MGAHAIGYHPTTNELDFIRKTFEHCHSFLTICGGVLAPLEAGILDGHRATGPRMMLPMVRQMAPMVEWTEKRWEHDGKLWTSGTLLNGTDMMRAFGQGIWGSKEGEEPKLVDIVVDMTAWPARDPMFRDVDGVVTRPLE